MSNLLCGKVYTPVGFNGSHRTFLVLGMRVDVKASRQVKLFSLFTGTGNLSARCCSEQI